MTHSIPKKTTSIYMVLDKNDVKKIKAMPAPFQKD